MAYSILLPSLNMQIIRHIKVNRICSVASNAALNKGDTGFQLVKEKDIVVCLFHQQMGINIQQGPWYISGKAVARL